MILRKSLVWHQRDLHAAPTDVCLLRMSRPIPDSTRLPLVTRCRRAPEQCRCADGQMRWPLFVRFDRTGALAVILHAVQRPGEMSEIRVGQAGTRSESLYAEHGIASFSPTLPGLQANVGLHRVNAHHNSDSKRSDRLRIAPCLAALVIAPAQLPASGPS